MIVREKLVSFPPDDGYLREKIGEWWVEYKGSRPTIVEVEAVLKPQKMTYENLIEEVYRELAPNGNWEDVKRRASKRN